VCKPLNHIQCFHPFESALLTLPGVSDINSVDLRCHQMRPGTSTATIVAGEKLGFVANAEVTHFVRFTRRSPSFVKNKRKAKKELHVTNCVASSGSHQLLHGPCS